MQLHRNAAAWYEGHGLADDAIHHAVAAGEMTWAARLIEQHFDEIFYLRGEAATIQRWISALPADLVRSRPRLLLAQAQLASASGRLEAVEPLIDAAERASASAADEPFEPTIGPAASLLVNVPALDALCRSYLASLRGDPEAMAIFASRALAESRQGEWALRSNAEGCSAVAEWLRGRLAEAERGFVSSIAGWRAAGQATVAAWGSYQLGQVHRARGRLDAAVMASEQALEAAAGPGGTPLHRGVPRTPGRGGLPAQRTRPRPGLRHRGHRAVPPVRLHPAAGGRAG